jgi:hypothetical protein
MNSIHPINRKMIALFTTVALMISLFTPGMNQKASAASAFSEDFENGTIGLAPGGWNVSSDGGTVTVEQIADGANPVNQALKIERTAYNQPLSAFRTFPAVSGIVTIDVRMQAAQTNAYISGPIIYDSSNSVLIQLGFQNNGSFGWLNNGWQNLRTYAADQWYDFRIVANTQTDTFDLFIDNTLELDNQPFNAPAADMAKMEFSVYDWTKGVAYYDGIQVAADAVAANTPPSAMNVSITGNASVGHTLTGNYTYSDADGDAESGTLFRWYRATNAGGTGKTEIAGATASTYTLAAEDEGSYIFFEVTPKAASGDTTGVSVSSAPVSIGAGSGPATYYVDAVNGNDASGDGSGDHPWKTIGKAAAIAQAGDTVKIRSGTYRETVKPANSGTAGAPITYEADAGADVTISGADLVTGPWTVHSGNVYKTTATLGIGEWKNQVFVDGESMQLARWPNAGADLLTPSTALTDEGTDDSKIIDGELTQPDGYWNGAGVVVTDKYAWTLASTTVTSYTTGRLNLGSVATFGLGPNSPYYVIGKLAALDTGKEWYYDSGSTTLYLQTPAGDNPADHVVEAKQRALAFDLKGKNAIKIKGVKLFASTIDANDATYIDIDGIDAKYVSHYELDLPDVFWASGIQIGGSHNILHNSTLAYSPGNLVTLTGQNNEVVNNVLHDAAYGPVYTTNQANVFMDGRELLVSNNTLYNSGRSVIAGRPQNSRIQYNNAYNAMTLTDDGGFMYFSNVDGEGTEIHHNVLRGANSSSIDGGIYLDFACWDFKVFNNVISDVNAFGVFFHAYTLFTEAYNNTFYNKSWFRMKNDGGATDAYGTRVVNNISYDDMWIAPAFGVVERNNFKSGDPLFADTANADFHLQPSSTAIDAGEVIEGVTDGYAGSAPDIGAYESGGPQWTAGHDFANPPHPAFTTTNFRYHTLLKNGFFERPIDPADGWTKTNSQTATIEVSGNTASSSRHAWTHGLKLGSGEDGVEQTVTGLQPNTEYELRGFGKAAVSGQKIRIGVKGYGGQDTFKEITDTVWGKAKFRFTTGPSDTSATVYVYKSTTGGYAFADDVTLMEVDPDAPAELDQDYTDDDSSPGVTVVNDRDIGTGLNQYEYVGNWLQGPNINAYKGDASFSNTAGDYYQVRFEGTQIKLHSEKQSVAGIVAVSVDGGPETLIDLYAAVSEPQALVFTSPEMEFGEHILKVRITGDQNASAGGTWHVADKVEVIHPPTKTINDRDIGTGNYQYEFVGTWLQGPNIHAYKGDASFSQTPGDYYQIRFEGTQIKLYSERQGVAGIVAVSVDGGPETLIDLYAPESTAQSLIFTSPEMELGQHILKVRITGDQNPSAGGIWHVADKAVVTVPALKVVNDREIGAGLYQYNFTGTWLQGPNIHAYKGDASFSNTPGDFYQMRFNGKQIKVYSEKGSVMGIVGISIDGGAETMVDLYAPDSESQYLAYTSPELSDGEHVLKVRVTGNQNPAGGGIWHVADKVEIMLGSGTDPDPTPEIVELLNEDFEDTAVGSLPAGWTQATIHPVGVTADSEGNHSLTLVEPGNDGVGTGASVHFDPIQKKAVVKVRVMAEQLGRTVNFLTLLDSQGAKVLELLYDFDYDGSGLHNIARRTPDGNWYNLMEYNANQWYDVEVNVDLKGGVYAIKIGGADVAADIPLLHAASDIAGYATSTYGWNAGTFHVDDIKIAGPQQEQQTVKVTGIAVAGENGVSAIDSLGGTLQMIATVTPDHATNKSVDWTVVAEDGSATSAATIDANGLLTAVADGKVKVVATAKDGSGVRGESVVTIDSTPPEIATPGKLTFLQTEPVLVSFSATDNVSGLKSLEVTFNGQTSAGPISLDPLSLSVGTYPIVVTATDNFGHRSTANFSLAITIDADHLDELIALGFDKGWIDNAGTEDSLMSHVNQILRDQGDNEKLQNSITSMENKVSAQRGKHIDEHFADMILENLAMIKNSIGN